MKELGIDNKQTDNGTYKCIDNTNINTLINDHTNKLGADFGLKVMEVNQCLPSIYWLPKMHKSPSKARFIIAAPKKLLHQYLNFSTDKSKHTIRNVSFLQMSILFGLL